MCPALGLHNNLAENEVKSTYPLLHFSAGLPRFPLHVGEEIKVGEEQEKHHSVGDDDLEIERKMVLRQ